MQLDALDDRLARIEASIGKKSWRLIDWLGVLIIPILLSGATLWFATPVSEGYDEHIASKNPPCIESSGVLAPIVSYPYPSPAGRDSPQSAWVDWPNGSLYVYVQNVTNSGGRDLHDVTIRLNAPGDIVSAWTDRNETTTTAADVLVLFSDDDGSIPANRSATTRDPRILRPPELGLAFLFALTPLTAPPPENSTPPIRAVDSEWAKRIVWADGLPTLTYRLPVLKAGTSWQTTTILFGNRTDIEAAGTLSAAARTANADYYRSFALTAFTPPPGKSDDNPGADPWTDRFARTCWYGNQ